MDYASLRFPLLWAFLFASTFSRAQSSVDDFSFFRFSNIPVSHSHPLAQPWAGGMNAVLFFEIDLDFDGASDLFVFDKHGNRISTFVNRNGHYEYAPEYARFFPALHDWAILYDYNHDSKPDIFTYGLAGIAVYENISENNQIAFRLKCEQLNAFYYNGYINIFAAPTDYPVIEDIDGDGHLDILNFWVLGKFVHHLRNYSDDPNTFDFRLENECWGHFSESADDNGISLLTDCEDKSGMGDEPTRHTGSTMLLHDFDHNGLPDLLLGDMDFPNLILLYNNGTITDALMTAQDTAFPVNMPVNLYAMPSASFITLPGEPYPSLFVSPADPSLTKSQDLHNVWRYDYNDLLGQYALISTSFLQEEMIDVGSGALPVLYDFSGDGLPDLFIANYGSYDSTTFLNGFPSAHFSSSIHYYLNVGNPSHPEFSLQSADFGMLKQLNLRALYPTFGDFNGDGLTDMLCGQEDGTLLLVPHNRLLGEQINISENYQNIDVGKFSTPQFFDLDQDGHNDLLIGNQRGLISYYHNQAANSIPTFTLVTDTLGGIDVRNAEQSYYGYSIPCFYRDARHGTVLFCGSESGNLFYYNNIDNNLEGLFTGREISETDDESCDHCAHILHEGTRCGCAIFPLLSEQHPDLIVGNYAGGVSFFAGRTPTHSGVNIATHSQTEWQVAPNPATDLIHILSTGNEQIEDILIYDLTGRICLQSHEAAISTSQLRPGVYVVEINGQTKLKVVISK